MTESLDTVICPCGSPDPGKNPVHAADEISGEAFTYLRCPDCSLERLSPRPVAARIGAYYPTTYVPHSGFGVQGRADHLKRLIYEVFWAPLAEVRPGLHAWRWLLVPLLFPVRHRTILAFHPPASRHVFEFGAAKGTDLTAFRAAGWDVDGCEPSHQACEIAAAQGLHLQEATAEAAVLENQAYTCILFNNVFEHIHEPASVLRKCADALQPGGVLILIVPNHASLVARLVGAAWPGYDAPRHIWGWTPRAITAELHKTGFEVEAIRHQATGAWLWRSVLDMRHAAARPGKPRLWLARHAAAAFLPISVLAAWMGRGDFMRVIARRTAGHPPGERPA